MEDPEGMFLVSMYARLFIMAQLVGIVVIAVAAAISVRKFVFGTTRHRRTFRCALTEREVEVEFEERRVFGVVEHAEVVRCSAFESPTAVTCARRCVNSAFRRQWLPSVGH